MSLAWDDDEREEGVLTKVHLYDGGHFDLTSSNGWSCGMSNEQANGVVPKEGDHFVTWGGVGLPIRGMALNRVVLWYRTREEQAVENRKQVEAMKAERVTNYESKRADFDARVAKLPAPFRERIEGFRQHGGDEWRWDHEPYELMCCEQAVIIAAALPDRVEFDVWREADWKVQRERIPEIDEGHSGNSFGAACMLSRLYLDKPSLVPKAHGALCPLVGCKDYGCFAGRGK